MSIESPSKSPPWFRFYSEALDDFKLKRVAMHTQQHRMFVMGVWAALLALANSSPERGKLLISTELPYTVDDIALRIDLDSDTCKTVLDAFVANKMIHLEDGVYVISNWDNRQFTYDNSNERVRKYREKRKALDLPVAPRYDSNVIWNRDDRKCVYCGNSQNICVDHIYPIDLGGTDHYDNLATACKVCSSGKIGRTPEQAGYRFVNPEAETRYKSYMCSVMVTRKPVTVTLLPQSQIQNPDSTNVVGDKSPGGVEKPKKQLMSVFLTETGLKMPHRKSDEGFWWASIAEIYELVDNDVGSGNKLIRRAVKKMQADKLTISNPNSIVNICRALQAESKLITQNGKHPPIDQATYEQLRAEDAKQIHDPLNRS